ncbi:translocation/assembly module TamB domain-containing protein [Pseudophaeobacter sp. EL27]|uniref:translocation/assembly module TamB domain-containing protein n=1 Tax=Pseudophaeobacter sp. EL27 TaxID=2107580 RepID=UPI0015745F8A|nr:translocation/assembly module TamB domain-containing protein [Pseudophaeobacter sp. EL27]
MHKRSLFLATLLASSALPLGAQNTAQDSASEPSYLESFLEDTLSAENQYITVTGLNGAFSSQATIDQITLADEAGVWLQLRGAELDWNRLALLRGELSINHLKAAEITVLRPPHPLPQDPSLPAPEASPFQLPELPVSIELGDISIARIDLDEALFGFAARLNLQGDLKLAEGSLATQLKVNRLDKPGDRLELVAGYANDSRQITLDLALEEAAGGLISTALALPAAPSLQVSVAGTGPVEDFTAQIALASNDTPRLTGTVALSGLTNSPDAETTTGEDSTGIGFSADLGGDIDALLLPDYRPFFGPDLKMSVRGSTTADAGIALDSFALRSQALRLTGALAITATGQLDTANIRAAITPPKGQAAVILPLPGADTTLAGTEILAQKTSDGPWTVAAELRQLSHPEALIEAGVITANGELALDDSGAQRLDGVITAKLQGLKLRDPDLAAAIGSEVSLASALTTAGTSAFSLKGMLLQGEDYQASGDLGFEGLASGLKVNANLRIGAGNLQRFSDLAGLPLSGAMQSQFIGSVTPLSGAFEADLALQGQGISAGIAILDELIEGNLALVFKGARGSSGLEIDQFELQSGQISAEASGTLDSRAGALSLRADLRDLNPLVPQVSGPLSLEGDVTRAGDRLTGQLQLRGPHASFAQLEGSAQLDGAADITFAAALAEMQRFVPELPGKLTAQGTAQRRDGRWQISSDAKAPSGAEAQLSGSYDETSGLADVTAKGRARLEGANPFITPNLLKGSASFDLALKGVPSLEALSGSITTRGASLALPAAAQRIDAINAAITLQNARAQLQVSARPRDGGTLRLSGPMALTAPFDSALRIGLSDVTVTDHLSYETLLNGDLAFSGPLTGNSRLSGRIDVGESNINLNTAGGAISAAPIPPIRHIGEARQARQTRARAGLIQTAASTESSSNIGLDLVIDAPARIFARGRGLNAELGGRIHLRGSTAALAPSGQISLKRGTFDILGRRLELDEGRITLLGDLKPHLEFRSSASTSTGTATLEIEGTVDAPQIKVTSDPPRPSEEALALLLFGDNIDDLSPLALARLAKSALDLSGRELGGQSRLREATGADNAEVGLDSIGSGLLGLGGYIGEKAYTDFNVNTQGDSELSINIDLSDSVTVTGTVDSEGESGFGLFFKRDY